MTAPSCHYLSFNLFVKQYNLSSHASWQAGGGGNKLDDSKESVGLLPIYSIPCKEESIKFIFHQGNSCTTNISQHSFLLLLEFGIPLRLRVWNKITSFSLFLGMVRNGIPSFIKNTGSSDGKHQNFPLFRFLRNNFFLENDNPLVTWS